MSDRIIAACRMVVDAPGPVTQKAAIRNLRELVRQLDQEEPCQSPSTAKSSTNSSDTESSSTPTQTTSAHGSHATSARTRTIKPTQAQQPRRRTP